LLALDAWRGAWLFTGKERAALEWTEAVTFVSRSRVPESVHAAIRQWFTDIEIVKLTMVIAATTAWNRVEMSFPRSHDEAE
jgi:alkylhydroperoxidase family enzyme